MLKLWQTLLFWLLLTSVGLSQEYELSYLVIEAKNGQVLYSQEPDKLRIPASTLKVVTAASALEKLGPDYRFQTEARASGPIRKGRVDILCLVGDADPELSKSVLLTLAHQLRERGLRKVGKLTVAPGPHSFPPYGAGWSWDDAGSYYSPEISGLNLQGGVWPMETVQAQSVVDTRTEIPKGYWLIPGREGLVTGRKPPKKLAPPRTAIFTGKHFRQLLESEGIKVESEVTEGVAPGELLATHHSRPLSELLETALAKSDNLALELFYRASELKPPDVLKKATYRQVDGSGLSRYNLISCRQLVSVLKAHPELKTLVPTPSKGTLRKRFLGGLVTNHLAAKTGTMSNISGLTGYLFPGTAKECYFAILINGHLDSTAKRKAIEDRLVENWVREIGYPYLVKTRPERN